MKEEAKTTMKFAVRIMLPSARDDYWLDSRSREKDKPVLMEEKQARHVFGKATKDYEGLLTRVASLIPEDQLSSVRRAS